MSYLFTIPEFLTHEILAKWTTVKDLQQLDKSFSGDNHKKFIETISNTLFVLEDASKLQPNDIIWICSKKLKLMHLYIDHAPGRRKQKDISVIEFGGLDTTMVESIALANCSDGLLPLHNFQNLVNSCPKLKKIEVKKVKNFSDDFILGIHPSILQQLTHIKAETSNEGFTFNSYTLTKTSFIHIAENCRNLEALEGDIWFGENFLTAAHVTQDYLIDVLKHNPKLRVLQDVVLSHVNDKLLEAVVEFCPNMEIFECAVEDLHFSTVLKLLKGCTHIHQLGVACGESLVTYTAKAEDGSKQAIICAVEATDKTLIDFFSTVTDLTDIQIGGLSVGSITSDLLLTIARKNPRLSKLIIEKCDLETNSSDFVTLLTECPLLEKLHLSDYSELSNDDLRAIFQRKAGGQQSYRLTELNLSKHNTLDAETLIEILTECPAIVTLCINLCPALELYKVTQYLYDINRNMQFPLSLSCLTAYDDIGDDESEEYDEDDGDDDDFEEYDEEEYEDDHGDGFEEHESEMEVDDWNAEQELAEEEKENEVDDDGLDA